MQYLGPAAERVLKERRGIVLGKKSGIASIKIKCEELGLDAPLSTHARLLDEALIRDVRKDFSAPKMPFVIGVMGVGGLKANPDTIAFREAMTAPAPAATPSSAPRLTHLSPSLPEAVRTYPETPARAWRATAAGMAKRSGKNSWSARSRLQWPSRKQSKLHF